MFLDKKIAKREVPASYYCDRCRAETTLMTAWKINVSPCFGGASVGVCGEDLWCFDCTKEVFPHLMKQADDFYKSLYGVERATDTHYLSPQS
jgi:hypothetical protein